MKNISNKIKYIVLAVIAVSAFVFVKEVSAQDQYHGECLYVYGSSSNNCDNGSNNNGNNGNDNSNDLNVSTLSATSIDEDSATLRGEITDLDESEDFERYFEWGTSSGSLNNTLYVSGNTNDEGTFSRTLTGLDENRTYYFRACAESLDSSDNDCGSTYNFRTDEDNYNNSNDNNYYYDNSGNSSVVTTEATSITSSTAILNGVVINRNDSQRVWFEWGSTTNLGKITSSRTVTDDQALVSIQVFGLVPNQAYFFRLVSDNGEKGDFKAFIAKSASVGTTTNTYTNTSGTNTNTSTNTTDTTITNSGQYLNVDLISSVDSVSAGDTVSFAAVYENLTTGTIKDITIVVDFPEGVEILKTGAGQYLNKNQIEIHLDELSSKAKSSFTIETKVGKDALKGSVLVSVINALHADPKKAGEWINTTDYSIIKIIKSSNSQSASVASSGFLPHTLTGWLLLILVITALIVLARTMYKKHEKKKEEEEKDKPGIKITR